MFIYLVTNKINGKQYIGQTTKEFKEKLKGNKYAQGNKGRPLSEEHKKKISKALMCNKNGIHSIEGRTKMIGNKYASKSRRVGING